MNGDKLTIGLDLDQTIYGFPRFFAAFIPAMHAAGHRLCVTSNHLRSRWPEDCERLRALGIDPDMLDPHLMQQGPIDHGRAHKRWMAKHVDFMFDDMVGFNEITKTVVFVCPHEKAED